MYSNKIELHVVLLKYIFWDFGYTLVLYLYVPYSVVVYYMYFFLFNDQTCFCRTATNSISSFPLLLRVHLRLILILNAPFSTSSFSFFFIPFLQQMTISKSKKNQKTIKSHPTHNGYKTKEEIKRSRQKHTRSSNNNTKSNPTPPHHPAVTMTK